MSKNYGNKQNNNGGKKEFAPSIGFWATKSGKGYSVFVDEKVMGELDKIQEGGRLFLSEVTNSNSDRAPQYRVVYLAPVGEEAQASDTI
jgi:hypothetical protein